MAIILVSNNSELASAIRTAGAGDTISLSSGTYNLSVRGENLSGATIEAASGADVTFSQMSLNDVQNLTIDDITISGSGSGTGFLLRDSDNITLENSIIKGFEVGAIISGTGNLSFGNNTISDIGLDGTKMSSIHDAMISGNSVSLNNTSGAKHSDGMQFFGGALSNVTIQDNLIKTHNNISHGIYAGNGTSSFNSGTTIDHNTVISAQVLGIAVGETNGLTITNNIVLQDTAFRSNFSGVPVIRVNQDATGVEITGNTTHRLPVASGVNWEPVGFTPPGWMIADNTIVPIGTPPPDPSDPIDPTLSGDLAITLAAGGSVALTTADLAASDDASGPGDLSFSVTNVANGHLALQGALGTTITSFTQAQLSAGDVFFVHDGSNTTTGGFDVRVSDGDGGSAGPVTVSATVTDINHPPTGQPTISDTGPTEGQALTAATGAIQDPDGIASGFSYQWQNLIGSNWTDIAGAQAASFTPVQAQVNTQLHVLASFTDGGGATETVISASTIVVGDLFTSGAAAQTFSGTPGDDNAATGDGNDTLNGNSGADVLSGDAGNDTINGGAGNDTIRHTIGSGGDTINGGADTDTLVIFGTTGADSLSVDYNGTSITQVGGAGSVTGVESVTADLLRGIDTLTYTDTTAAVTVNLTAPSATGFTSIAGIENVTGGGGADTLTGSGTSANVLNGGANNDVLQGVGGGDILTGGAGADSITAGGLNDDLRNFVRFTAASEFGDTVTNFDTNATTTDDLVQFSGALNTAWDDGNNDNNFLFAVGNGVAGAVNASVGQADGNAEALLLTGIGGEGVANASLGNAALVSAAFNTHFNITASNGEDALLVVNDTDGNVFSAWRWVQAGDGETAAGELTLVGVLSGNATATVENFDFV